ncbi:hypothetical protein SEVIR_1G135800v4 [Setaria viridis]|uniref:Uncharacterized protein n=2 Tax=Setaria TaxID=4554 RepID=A0A368PKC5_SETIT|nr:hypothetical protein SETIT_1G136800v2 [Setaria italica]TKW38741.1 hypothetical protein SEVIR_1G135800v2 [Setaria viridis]
MLNQWDNMIMMEPAQNRGGDAPVRSSFLLVTLLIFHLISFDAIFLLAGERNSIALAKLKLGFKLTDWCQEDCDSIDFRDEILASFPTLLAGPFEECQSI